MPKLCIYDEILEIRKWIIIHKNFKFENKVKTNWQKNTQFKTILFKQKKNSNTGWGKSS